MERTEQFKQIVSEMIDTYEKKNADYGNSFEKTLNKWGVNIGLARIEDKFNRVTKLLTNSCQQVNDESVEDTLKDLATYSIMLLMWLEKDIDVNVYESATLIHKTNHIAYNYDYLCDLKNWKLKGGINSNGFPTKTMYADVDKYTIDNNILKIYFKNVRNTRNQVVGSGTYIGEYPIDRLSDFGLEKSQIIGRKS